MNINHSMITIYLIIIFNFKKSFKIHFTFNLIHFQSLNSIDFQKFQ